MFEWGVRPQLSHLLNGKRVFAPFFFRWRGMINRCYSNSKAVRTTYHKGRGITVCEEWLNDFWKFYDWCVQNYEPGKSVDRINNDGPYSPQNCRWATPLEQQLNARMRTPKRLAGIKVAFKIKMKNHDKKWGNVLTRTSKFCYLCKVKKTLKNFSKNRTTSDGLQKYCRDCGKLIIKKYKERVHVSNQR